LSERRLVHRDRRFAYVSGFLSARYTSAPVTAPTIANSQSLKKSLNGILLINPIKPHLRELAVDLVDSSSEGEDRAESVQ